MLKIKEDKMKENKIDFHGGNVYKIYREKGMKEILDYSSNINPYGLPEQFKEAIISNLSILEKYPDPDYIELILLTDLVESYEDEHYPIEKPPLDEVVASHLTLV